MPLHSSGYRSQKGDVSIYSSDKAVATANDPSTTSKHVEVIGTSHGVTPHGT